jgi:hypothetical protein
LKQVVKTELKDSYDKAKEDRKGNGYGPEGKEGAFKVIDMLGTVAAGYEASDIHDQGYETRGMRKSTADSKLGKKMMAGSISNITKTNGIFRAVVGLAITPIYYGAVAAFGGGAYEAGQAKAINGRANIYVVK